MDKLLNLKLSEVQQREIVRVLLHCIGSEKAYNPYYTLILSRLLTSSASKQSVHSYMITLQYSLWDYFRGLGETDVGGAEVVKNAGDAAGDDASNKKKMKNLAKAYAWWCAKSGLGLNIFKVMLYPLFTWTTMLILFVGRPVATPIPHTSACLSLLPSIFLHFSLHRHADPLSTPHSPFFYRVL